MGVYDDLTFASILSPEMADVARKIGSDKIRPVDVLALKSEKLLDLVKYWNKARNGMPLPCAASFDPISIPQHLSQVFLIQVDHDPVNFSFRVVGEDPHAAFGTNVAGQEVASIELFDLPVGKMMTEGYMWILAQRKPVAMAGPNGALTDGYTNQEMIYLPFSDGGARITRILGAAVYYRN
jgi:hypothetical protein